MAETEVKVTVFERVQRLGSVVATLAAVCGPIGGWCWHLEATASDNHRDIAEQTRALVDVKTAAIERDARWAADQAAQSARVGRIEESRTVGLQRLATVEEAVKGTNRTLDSISTKLDRLLMGGRGR